MAFWSQMILCLMIATPLSLNAVRRVEDEVVSWAWNGEGELCHPSIVADTCADLNDVNSLEEALGVPHGAGAGEHFLKTLGLTGDYDCTKMCAAVRDSLKSQGTLPPASDVGCIDVEGDLQCDIDLSPAVVEGLLSKKAELPDMGDKRIIDAEERGGRFDDLPGGTQERKTSALLQTLMSTSDALTPRLARMFRIHPVKQLKVVSGRLGGNDEVDGGSDWRRDAIRINEKSQAYLAGVMKKFSKKNTKASIIKWFGKASYEDAATRAELQRVMNGVSAMLDSVEYVYDPSQCGPRTYAFVYPKTVGQVVQNCMGTAPAEGEKCVQNSEGKFMFFLCDVYMNAGDAEKIETLLHEGSHHATAYTTDVCVNDFFMGNSEPFIKTVPVADLKGKGVGQHVWIPMRGSQVKDTYTEMGGDVMFAVVEISGDKAKIRVVDDFDDCMNADAHVAYGRSVCQALAKLDPAKALKNADNFCYYVVDVMTGNGASKDDSCRDGHGGFCVGDRFVETYGSKSGLIMFPVPVTPCYGWGCSTITKCTVKFDGKNKNQEVSCSELQAE